MLECVVENFGAEAYWYRVEWLYGTRHAELMYQWCLDHIADLVLDITLIGTKYSDFGE